MKIKAYTLMEVTVAMLLSAICISICYMAYSLIGDYYRVFHQKNQTAAELLLLKQGLEKDFLRGKVIIKEENGFQVQLDTTKISYSFDGELVLRTYGLMHSDTFKLANKDLIATFEGKALANQDTLDEVSFKLFLDKQTPTIIHLNKHYSAVDLFH